MFISIDQLKDKIQKETISFSNFDQNSLNSKYFI